jgi:hypothetical protein
MDGEIAKYKVWVDNMGAKFLAFNPVFYGRMKHVQVDYHFARERVSKNLLDIDGVPTGDQIADGFTEAILLRKLGNLSIILI